MSEEQVAEYLERVEGRTKEVVADRSKALEMLKAAGICDASGNLTDLYR